MSMKRTTIRRCRSAAALALLVGIFALYPPAAAPKGKYAPMQAPGPPRHKPSPAELAGAQAVGTAKGQKTATCAQKADKPAAPVMMMLVPPKVKIPDLSGKTLEQAQSLLGNDLVLGTVTNNNPQWIVAKQNPRPGNDAPVCTSVELVMQAPPVNPPLKITKVPDIRDWPENLIQSRLGDFHLKYAGTSQKETAKAQPGTIFDQFPEPGAQVFWGTAVIRYSALNPGPERPPQLILTPSSISVRPGDSVTFTAKLDADQNAISYQFNFGDGTPAAESTAPQVAHTYQNDGSYTVQATAMLDGLLVQSAILEITVHPVIYTVTLSASPQNPRPGQPVEFHADVAPQPPSVSNPEYVFSFGDGSKSVLSKSPDAKHAYQEARTFQASVVMVADHGHKIPSGPVELTIVIPPQPSIPWGTIAMASALLAGVGFGAFKWVRTHLTRGVSLIPKPGTGELRLQKNPGSVVEAGFGFRTVHPSAVSNASFHSPVIAKIERIV